jgi:hypothetical protein
MDQRSDISANEVSDADLAEINARLDALDWNNMHFDAVPSICIEPVLLDPSAVADAELEFERQLALDTEHADNFVPAPGRIRCDCGWKLGEQASRALLSHIAAAAALAGSKQAEPTSSSHSRDGQPPQQHAGPGGHATPHLALTPRLQDQDPARA